MFQVMSVTRGSHTKDIRNSFVILDRDGTLIEERHYLCDPTQVVVLPGVPQALSQFHEMGLGTIMVSNQAGVGRGYYGIDKVQEVNDRLLELLQSEGAALDGLYFCPHAPNDSCICRKPRTGLADRAAADHMFDLQSSYVVGDKACDIELGQNIGAMTFLVRSGYGSTLEASGYSKADHIVSDLLEVVEIIRDNRNRDLA
jgi:D-glycero-D-manno-heptose 1,7-bisphosphate phosphatase